MLQLTRETRRHSEPNFNFGAFSFYAAEMKHSERKMKSICRRRVSCGSPALLRKPCRFMSQASGDVFLGGSCNPTQWRRDEAIPALKAAQVTFYNPQKTDWLPDLIGLEQQAKDNARVLLFVHDKETRSLASMVEVGERCALNKQTLVLAIEELGDQVMGEKLSERELKEMRRARNYMRDIAETREIRVFSQIRDAVQGCIDIVKKNYTKDDWKLVKKIDLSISEQFIKMRSNIENYSTNNKFSVEERSLAFRGLHGRDIPKDILMEDKPLITDTEFCMINAEYRALSKPSMCHHLLTWCSSNETATIRKEVFICGPVGDLDWKTKIAQPCFRENHIMTREMSDPEAEHLTPMEMKQIGRSRVLLFVFPSDTWGTAEMVMASYYIGLKKHKVVLCTQQLSENTLVHGERLTAYQTKDYNRCRMYLTDQAVRNGLNIFDNIQEAVKEAAQLAKQ